MTTPKTNVDELKELCLFLVERTSDLFVRLETLRVLLEERGVFSHAEFAQLASQLQARATEKQRDATAKATEAEYLSKLRQFLESFEGTKQ